MRGSCGIEFTKAYRANGPLRPAARGANINSIDQAIMSLSVAASFHTTHAVRGLLPLCIGAGAARSHVGMRRLYADDIAIVHVRAGTQPHDVTGDLK